MRSSSHFTMHLQHLLCRTNVMHIASNYCLFSLIHFDIYDIELCNISIYVNEFNFLLCSHWIEKQDRHLCLNNSKLSSQSDYHIFLHWCDKVIKGYLRQKDVCIVSKQSLASRPEIRLWCASILLNQFP